MTRVILVPNLEIVAGNHQSGAAGIALGRLYVVRVTDALGDPVVGDTVSWLVVTGSGTLSASATETDNGGYAFVRHTLGPTPGVQTVRATVTGDPLPNSVTFEATATQPFIPQLTATFAVPPLYGHHDTFVRDGIAFVCAWNSGVYILDVGNGAAGGTPSAPVPLSQLIPGDNGVPGGPAVHNAWWFHNPVRNETRYLFLGQEGPAVGGLGVGSSGDIHVIDVSDLTHPVEVAFFHLDGAGTHNFWMDEARQVLYAAYYNGGVVALDVSGVLQGDLASRLLGRVTSGGSGGTYAWGVMLSGGSLFVSDFLSGLWQLDPITLATIGGGHNVNERYTSDLWVAGTHAYTGTWGGSSRQGGVGNAIKVWRLEAAGPVLADSLILAGGNTISDIEVSPDGKLLLATTERGDPAVRGFYLMSLADPAHPAIIGRVVEQDGLHTGTFATIAGRLYVFGAKNPGFQLPALKIYDVTGAVP